tara:strand:+ start:2405 stop:4657 length:2253 start_codon:yes stop_codon:yes gene_type:complete
MGLTYYKLPILLSIFLLGIVQVIAQTQDYAEATLRYGGTTQTVKSVSDISFNDFDIKVGPDKTYDITGDESDVISKNDYFYLKGYGLLQYESASKSSSSTRVIEFQDKKTGKKIEKTYTLSCDIPKAETTLNIGGKSYKVVSSSDITQDDFNIKVDVSGDGTIGNYNRKIIGSESTSIQKNDYLYISSYGLLQYKGADRLTSTNPEIEFKDVSIGNTIRGSLSNICTAGDVDATLNLGGYSYAISSVSDTSLNDFSIKIDNVFSTTYNIVGQESQAIKRNDYFYLKGFGFVRYKGSDRVTSSAPEMDLVLEFDGGNIIRKSLANVGEGEQVTKINYGGKAFKIIAASDPSFSNFDIKVDLDDSGTIGDYSLSFANSGGSATLQKNDYVVLKDFSILRYDGADRYTSSSPSIKFKNEITGEIIEISYQGCTETGAKATITVSGKTYNIESASDTSIADFNVKVDLNGNGNIGDYNINIINDESADIQRNDYVYLNSYGLVRYKGSKRSTSSNPVIEFEDVKIGDTIEKSYPVCTDSIASTDLKIGGRTYEIVSTSDASSNDFDIKVDMNGDGGIGNYEIEIVKNSGSSISKNEHFILWGGSHPLLKYLGATRSTSSDSIIQFRDFETNERIEIPFKTISEEVEDEESREVEPRIPQRPEQQEVPKTPQCINGCLVDDTCIPIGIRNENGYCDVDKTLKTQKQLDLSCENNYECATNQCSSGQCIDLEQELRETKGLLQKILDWLGRLFGFG